MELVLAWMSITTKSPAIPSMLFMVCATPLETGFSLNPCAKDVLAKWNTLGLLIAATLANAAAGKLMLSRQQKNSTNL